MSWQAEDVKQAAAGRWREILSAVGGVSADRLDGRNHPCPKCSTDPGDDRFSMVDEAAGALLCRKCFSTRNGDGLSAVQWLRDCKLPEAIQLVGNYLGLTPPAGKGKPKAKPDDHLVWLDWNPLLADQWCLLVKPGITPESMLAAGCRLARYRQRYPVFALPVFGEKMKVCGWVLWEVGGGQLPSWSKEGKISWQKMLTTGGSEKGLLGESALRGLAAADVVWKTEGPGDMLALAGIIPPELRGRHVVITNSAGTNERPLPWCVNLLAGKTVYVLHDCDVPGQYGSAKLRDAGEPGGAARWAAQIARKADSCRNIILPYEIAEKSGKDVRDWVREGRTYAELLQLVEQSEPVQPAVLQAIEDDDDPSRLAAEYQARHCIGEQGHLLLRNYRSGWIRYTGNHWVNLEPGQLNSDAWAFCRDEFRQLSIEAQEDGLPPETIKVSKVLVGNVLAALEPTTRLSGQIESGQHTSDGQQRDWISLRNGCLHVDKWLAGESDSLLPHDPEWLNFSALPYNYDPAAKCPKWLAFLDRVMEGDGDREAILQEFAGYCLVYDTSLQTMMIMHGDGANGKSVFLAGLESILGRSNCSHLPLENLGEKYVLLATAGKLANLVPEVGEIDKLSEGVLKGIVSGEPITIDRKYLSTLEFWASARMVVACNNLPRFTDRTDGIWRRLQVIPFRTKIAPEERVLGMDSPDWWAATGELPGMLNWALEGLRRLRKTGWFTGSMVSEAAKEEYRQESDPAGTYLRESYYPDPAGAVEYDALYRMYREWCIGSGYRPLAKSNFGRVLWKVFPHARKERRRLGPGGARVAVCAGISVGAPDNPADGDDDISDEIPELFSGF